MTDFYERSGLMQIATIAEKPGKQAISGRFRAGRTYRGRIKDDHKIDPYIESDIIRESSLQEET